MASVLFIQTAFLGDAILSTALVETWHHYHPEDSIDVLVRKGHEKVFENSPGLRKVHVWDKKQQKYRNLFRLMGEIRKQQYDKVINLQRFFSTGFITVCAGASETIGFHKNPLSFLFTNSVAHEINPRKGTHEIERNHALIKAYTGPHSLPPKLYPLNIQTFVSSLGLHYPYITISPASVWFTKQFPAEKWIAFLTTLPQELEVVLLGGPADKDLCSDISEEVKRVNPMLHLKNCCGMLDILGSAAIMKQAQMNYVNDSAPLHIASAMNAPVCAIFCSTVPGFGFGPRSERSFVVETNNPLPCRPCGVHGKNACPEGHFNCAMEIATEQLYEALDR